MFSKKILLVLHVSRLCYSDWVSDWMTPVQDEFGVVKDLNTRKYDDSELKRFEDEELSMIPIQELPNTQTKVSHEASAPEPTNYLSLSSLNDKLLTTLNSAKELAEVLRAQIDLTKSRELAFKEAIANGRFGVSTVTVYTLDRTPRSYVIRDGFWSLCNGVVQPPADNPYSKQLSSPRCIGLEMPTKPDPCVFNSVTKYETVPTRRRLEYVEDDYLCLKSGFNSTIQQYLSVPKRVVNDTCQNGIVRSLADNVVDCGLRVLSEYTYYPNADALVPREYCSGACHLVVAWHVSNATIENFEFLKEEPSFIKYFVKNGNMDRVI